MQKQSLLVASAFTVFSTVVFGVLWFTRRNNKRKVPTKWKAVGKVTNLCIYPLTSGHRMDLPMVMCTGWGPKMCQEDVHQFYDRNLIVYREQNNESLRGSSCPKLSLIHVEVCNKEEFKLKAPDMPDITVKIPAACNKKASEVHVYMDAKIIMFDCGDEVAQWISRYVYEKDSGCRIGFHDGSRRRNIHDSSYLKRYCYDYPILTNDATGMYAYLCSYSLINKTSVDELKNRILSDTEGVSVHNFRGNIIIESFDKNAYAEDHWSWVKIGDAVFYVVKPNTRCMITNIHPETAARVTNNEPLATLKKFRRLKELTNVDMEGDDPVMGAYMGLQESGIISVDDTVYIGEP